VVDCLPASVQRGAKRAIFEITNAEDKEAAELAVDHFVDEYGLKWPKAAAKIVDDRAELLAFYDFPAEHWGHLRTSNPIESTFSPVRARTNVTRGAGSRASALGMAFKLIQAAEGNWRKVNAPHLVALVAAGQPSSTASWSRGSKHLWRGKKQRSLRDSQEFQSTTLDNGSARSRCPCCSLVCSLLTPDSGENLSSAGPMW